MSQKITRREALAAAAAGAGMLGCAHASTTAVAGVGASTTGSMEPHPSAFLPNVWGDDFML